MKYAYGLFYGAFFILLISLLSVPWIGVLYIVDFRGEERVYQFPLDRTPVWEWSEESEADIAEMCETEDMPCTGYIIPDWPRHFAVWWIPILAGGFIGGPLWVRINRPRTPSSEEPDQEYHGRDP